MVLSSFPVLEEQGPLEAESEVMSLGSVQSPWEAMRDSALSDWDQYPSAVVGHVDLCSQKAEGRDCQASCCSGSDSGAHLSKVAVDSWRCWDEAH
jgi:hypothetical protein